MSGVREDRSVWPTLLGRVGGGDRRGNKWRFEKSDDAADALTRLEPAGEAKFALLRPPLVSRRRAERDFFLATLVTMKFPGRRPGYQRLRSSFASASETPEEGE